MGKLSLLPQESTFTTSDFLVKVKSAGGGDVLVSLTNFLTAIGFSNGAWQTWTPTYTNLSGGTLTYSTYIQIGKIVYYKWKYTLGGANVSGSSSIQFTLPATLSSNYCVQMPIGRGGSQQGSGSIFDYVVLPKDTATAFVYVISASSSYANAVQITSTVPVTWGSGDVIAVQGMYEAA